jgi:hypothetical protein
MGHSSLKRFGSRDRQRRRRLRRCTDRVHSVDGRSSKHAGYHPPRNCSGAQGPAFSNELSGSKLPNRNECGEESTRRGSRVRSRILLALVRASATVLSGDLVTISFSLRRTGQGTRLLLCSGVKTSRKKKREESRAGIRRPVK